jgi:hypothetical protein
MRPKSIPTSCYRLFRPLSIRLLVFGIGGTQAVGTGQHNDELLDGPQLPYPHPGPVDESRYRSW